MATFTVTTGEDIVDANDGVLSLREAVEQARLAPGFDTIEFAQGLTNLRLDTTLLFDRDGGGVTIDGGADRQLVVETAFSATSAGNSALVVYYSDVTLRNLEFFGYESNLGRPANFWFGGQDAKPFLDSISSTLTLTDIRFRDMLFVGDDGNFPDDPAYDYLRDGADGPTKEFWYDRMGFEFIIDPETGGYIPTGYIENYEPRCDCIVDPETGAWSSLPKYDSPPGHYRESFVWGTSGENGRHGEPGGDAYLISVRDGTLALDRVDIDETVLLIGGAGGVGGVGGNGTNGKDGLHARVNDAYFVIRVATDGGDGGNGGTGGDGGDAGNAFVVNVLGEARVDVGVVTDLSDKMLAEIVPGSAGGLAGARGDGGRGTGFPDSSPDGEDGLDGWPGLGGMDGAPGTAAFLSTPDASSPESAVQTSVTLRRTEPAVFEGEDLTIHFDRNGNLDGDLLVKYQIVGSSINGSTGAAVANTSVSEEDLEPNLSGSGNFSGSLVLGDNISTTALTIATRDDFLPEADAERMAIMVTDIVRLNGEDVSIAENRDFQFARILEYTGSFALRAGDVTLPEGESAYIYVDRTGTTSGYDIDYSITLGGGVNSNDLAQADTLTGTLNFLPGTDGALAIRLDALLDNVEEGVETVTVRLDGATNRDPGTEQASIDTTTTVTVNLTDQTADTAINLIAVDTEVEEGEPIHFQMERTGSPDVNINVGFELVPRADALGLNEADLVESMPFLTDTAIFTAGGPNIIDVVIETSDDTLAEAREAFDIRIISARDVGSGDFSDSGFEGDFTTPKVVIAGIDEISGAIEASDQPVNVGVNSVVTNADESVPIMFEVFRAPGEGLDEDSALNTFFQVQYTIVPGEGFSAEDVEGGEDSLTGFVTFDRNGPASKIVSIETREDPLVEGIETYTIVLGEVTQSGSGDALSVQSAGVSGQINASDGLSPDPTVPTEPAEPTEPTEPTEPIEPTEPDGAVPVIVQKVARLYEAALDRDGQYFAFDGFNFWIDKAEGGADFRVLSAAFLNSPEFRTNFGDAFDQEADNYLTNVAFVDALYQSVLGRDGGPGTGRQFWIDKLEIGNGNRAAVLRDFAESPENVANTLPLIATISEESDGYWVFGG